MGSPNPTPISPEATMTDPVSSGTRTPRFALGAGTADFEAVVAEARRDAWANRLFDRDVSLWTTDQDVGKAIADRLGWLDAPRHFADRTAALAYASETLGFLVTEHVQKA
jgi:hypothetical protein